jgi:hypothetical protein
VTGATEVRVHADPVRRFNEQARRLEPERSQRDELRCRLGCDRVEQHPRGVRLTGALRDQDRQR